ncbi:MAG: hypothetical protein AAB958_01945 [Patescibacteria group bacterium]
MITIQNYSPETFGTFKAQAPKEKSYLPYLFAIAAIFILAAGYYFFFNQGVSISLKSPVLETAMPLTDLEMKVMKLPNFSFNAIESDFYKSLKVYGALPVVADSLGRVNPFIPY